MPPRVRDRAAHFSARQAFFVGVAGGPALIAVGYLVLIGFTPSWATSWYYAIPLALPLMIAVPAFVSARRREAFWMLVGAVIGVAVMLGIVFGLITLVAYGLSAPVPE